MYNRDGQEWLVCIVIIVARQLGTRLNSDDETATSRQERERGKKKKENETLRLLFIVMNGEQQEQYGEK